MSASPSPEGRVADSGPAATLLMVVLGVDTATADAVVGVTDDGEVVRETAVPPDAGGRPRHSQVLLPEIERSRRRRRGLGAGRPDRGGDRARARSPGCGSGSSTARALAQARELPLVPVGTLAALARGIAADPDGAGRLALPVLDARRGRGVRGAARRRTARALAAVRRAARSGWPIACESSIGPRWRPGTGRYDSPQSWRPPAPRLPRPMIRSTGSPHGTFARWGRRQRRRRRSRSSPCI